MCFCRRRFNLYLLAAAISMLALGCASWLHKKDDVSVFRVHIESEGQITDKNKAVPILRAQPLMLNIGTDPILSEADVERARLLDTDGGFAIEIHFLEAGAWRLEQYSSGYPGKHLAIFAQWSKKQEDGRWLAAPILVRRMPEGMLVFTPDATREESQKIVDGLNKASKKREKNELKIEKNESKTKE
jgi:hypothetical protein